MVPCCHALELPHGRLSVCWIPPGSEQGCAGAMLEEVVLVVAYTSEALDVSVIVFWLPVCESVPAPGPIFGYGTEAWKSPPGWEGSLSAADVSFASPMVCVGLPARVSSAPEVCATPWTAEICSTCGSELNTFIASCGGLFGSKLMPCTEPPSCTDPGWT